MKKLYKKFKVFTDKEIKNRLSNQESLELIAYRKFKRNSIETRLFSRALKTH